MNPTIAKELLTQMATMSNPKDIYTYWFRQYSEQLSIGDLAWVSGLNTLLEDHRKFGGYLATPLATYLATIPVDKV